MSMLQLNRNLSLNLSTQLQQTAVVGGSTTLTQAARDALQSDLHSSEAVQRLQAEAHRMRQEQIARQAEEARVEERMWTLDANWAERAEFVDMRQPIICGGGGCNPPYGTSQFWSVNGTLCTPESIAGVMFQIDRYEWARRKVQEHLAYMPGRVTAPLNFRPPCPATVDNYAIRRDYSLPEARTVAANAREWAVWVADLWRYMSLAQWASNVPWGLVRFGAAEFGWRTLPRRGLRPAIATLPSFTRRPIPVGARGYLNSKLFQGVGPSYNVSAYAQAGRDQYDDTAQWDVRRGDGADRLPAIIQPRVPRTREDFSPEFLYTDGLPTRWVRQNEPGTQYWLQPWPKRWGAYPKGTIEDKLEALFRRATEWPSDVVSFNHQGLGWRTRTAESTPVGAEGADGWCRATPTAQILESIYYAIDEAQFLSTISFFDAVERAGKCWMQFYEQLPEHMRPLNLTQLGDAMKALEQAKLNTLSEQFAMGAGAVTSVVAAINPIAGAVVAVIATVVGLLIRFAAEAKIVHTQNPLNIPAPYLRMIPATSETAACDFDPRRNSNSFVATKVDAVAKLAAAQIRPEQWYGALDAISRGQPATMPPPNADTKNTKLIKATAAVTGAAAGLAIVKYFW